MIYLIYGEEFFLARRYTSILIKESNIDNIINLDYEEDKIDRLYEEVMYNDIFGNKKLIILSNFSFKNINKDEEEMFNKIIDNIDDKVLIIKCEEKINEKNSLFKKIKSNNNAVYFGKLDRFKLADKIKEIFNEEGFKVNSDICSKIINRCGYNNYSSDNGYIFNEVMKLIAYKYGENSITNSDVESIISKNMENEIFNFCNIVISKNKEKIFNEFKIIKELIIDPYFIINTLSKQYRTLLQIKILSKEFNNDDIARELGVNKYMVSAQMNYINLYSNKEVMNILHKLYLIDIDMKSSSVDGYKVIENFLLNI